MTSSSSYDATVDIALKPSLRGLMALSLTHALALVILLAAMPDGPGMAVAGLLVGASWLYTRRHPALGFGRRAVQRLLWRGDGVWQASFGDGTLHAAELAPSSVVTGPVPVLRFRIGGQHASRVLFGDEASREAIRCLRARLATTDHDDNDPRGDA